MKGILRKLNFVEFLLRMTRFHSNDTQKGIIVMDYSPILISMKTASISILITFFLGVAVAKLVHGMKHEKIKVVLDGILTLPMVLPPTVAGFFLLYLFGVRRPIGEFLVYFLK